MKKIVLILLLSLTISGCKENYSINNTDNILSSVTSIATNYKQYQIDDWVYFDPISNKSCNQSNYWTIYNQNTTCYRFLVIDKNDTTSKSTIKLMLDHNVATSTFANYKTTLKNVTSNWTRHSGDVDIIDEKTIENIMQLTEKPEIGKSTRGKTTYPYLFTNTLYVKNKQTSNSAGYWTKTTFDNNENYAYTVTEYGNNGVVAKTKKRGVRPVITVNKSLLRNSSNFKNIDSKLAKATVYKYKFETKQYDGHRYRQLQGFTITKDKLVYHASNANNVDYGILYTYTGQDFKTHYKTEYGKTAHGNDLTYNSKTNKILVVGPDNYGEIYQYDSNLNFEKSYDLGNASYASIGYDYKMDLYYVTSSRRVYVVNNKFERLYSFDIPATGVYQGIEFHNGYLYVPTYESGSSNSHQLYPFHDKWRAITYVYNVKFNKDGTPTKDFGRLVDRLYITTKIGELEDIAFHNDRIVFGFAARANENEEYTFQFHSIPYNEIDYQPSFTVSYTGDNNIKTISIKSTDELKNINGWTLSSDLHTLSKQFTQNTDAQSINVCDVYNNCIKTKLNALTFVEEKPDNGSSGSNNNTGGSGSSGSNNNSSGSGSSGSNNNSGGSGSSGSNNNSGSSGSSGSNNNTGGSGSSGSNNNSGGSGSSGSNNNSGSSGSSGSNNNTGSSGSSGSNNNSGSSGSNNNTGGSGSSGSNNNSGGSGSSSTVTPETPNTPNDTPDTPSIPDNNDTNNDNESSTNTNKISSFINDILDKIKRLTFDDWILVSIGAFGLLYIICYSLYKKENQKKNKEI